MTDFDELQALAVEYAGMSSTQRRTVRQRLDLDAGRHPATKLPLANNGETCGSCVHSAPRGYRGRRYWKCDLLVVTFGPGTDIRVGWPACVKWEPMPTGKDET